MADMMIDGFRLVSEGDSAYSVRDSNRNLGHVVRYYLWNGSRVFRAFGQDFGSLSEAVAEFLKIDGVRPLDAKGDLAEAR